MSTYATLFAAEVQAPPQKRKLIGDYQEENNSALTRNEAAEMRSERLRVHHYQKCGGGYRVFRKRLHSDD